MGKGDKFAVGWAILLVVLTYLSLGCLIGGNYAADMQVYSCLQVISAAAYVLLGAAVLIPMRTYFAIPGSCLMILNSVLAIGKYFFLEYRTYHFLLIATFLLGIGYLIFELVRYFARRRTGRQARKTRLVGAILTVVYIGFSLFINVFRSQRLLISTTTVPDAAAGIAVVISLVATVIGGICIKDRRSKEDYIGKLLAIFFGAFILIFGVPLLMYEHANFAFDPSAGEQIICTVTEKDSSHRYKSGMSYHLTLEVNGRELRMDTDKVTYMQYEAGDPIELYLHNGAFDEPYYAYRFDELYRYR